jgi:hypothetical protein
MQNKERILLRETCTSYVEVGEVRIPNNGGLVHQEAVIKELR